MAFATQPNVNLTTTWTLIADGSAEGTAQVIGGWPAIFFIGSAAPAASSVNGHRTDVQFEWTGLTTEKIYARALSSDRTTTLSITRL